MRVTDLRSRVRSNDESFNGPLKLPLQSVLIKVLLFLLILSFCAFGYKTYIEHPWEDVWWKDNNPEIYEGTFEKWVWTPFKIDSSLYFLRLGNITTADLDPAESGLVANAKNARANATAMRKKCAEEMDYLERLPEVKEYRENYSMILAPVPIVWVATWVKIQFDASSEEYKHAVLMEQYCSEYGTHWESTMSISMDALASSMDKVDSEYLAIRASFDKANHSGICDSDYTGAGHTDCLDVKSALTVIEGNSTEGSYGTFNMVRKNLDGIRDEVKKSQPSMVNYSKTMNLIWQDEGVLDTLKELKKDSDTAFKDADGEYNSTLWDLEIRKKSVEDKIKKLDGKENIKLVTSALTIKGTVGASATGTIIDRFEKLEDIDENASKVFKSAKTAYTSTGTHGYLKNAIKNIKTANSSYTSLEIALPVLESDAKQVVTDEKAEAEKKISEAKSLVGSGATSEAVRYNLQEAEKHMSAGKNATDLGNKFKNFNLAAGFARTAISKQKNQSFNESIELKALKAELQQMINDAKKDGLSTDSQQKTLDSIKDEDYYWVKSELLKAENELVAMAKLEYGWLEEKRAELLKKIKLVGGDADDQLTNMAKEERGFVSSSGKIDYRKGLGKLKGLADTYASVEKVVNGYMDDIVASSLMAEAEVFVDSVALDTPSNITIDILIINTDQYTAQNVKKNVKLPVSVDLMYTDIVNSSEFVGSVLMASSNSATLYLKEVKPFARQRIVFETTETIAHTTKVKRTAAGLGDGSASVEEQIDFKLDSAVNSLTVPERMENVRIDGWPAGRALSKGKHTLTARYRVEDAYNESIQNIKVSPVGLNSQVTYDVVIDPKIDLDSVAFFVDPGAKMYNLNVFSLSGESVGKKKKISDNRYSYVVSGLTANDKASVRVSYILENTSSYVAQQLALFNSTNQSQTMSGLVSQAQASLSIGDTSTALKKIKEAQAQQKKESTEAAKTKKKVEKLKSDIKTEMDEINNALVKGKGLNSSFLAKLSARADELGRRLNESAGKSPSNAIKGLEAVDLRWKSKEVTAFRKDVFKQYNELKKKFADAGNTSTPREFLGLESDLNKLEVSGRLEYVMELISDLEKAKSLVKTQESASVSARAGQKSNFESLKSALGDRLDDYDSEAKAAKGTEFSSLFKYTKKEVEKKITDIEKIVDSGDPKLLDSKLKTLNSTGRNLAGTLSLLKNQSQNKLDLIEKLYNSSKGQMDDAAKGTIEQKISSMKRLMAAGQYVNSLRAGNKILEDINKTKKGGDSSLLILGVTALAILGVIAAYLFKQREEKKPEKKELKKLEKVEGTPKTGNPEPGTQRDPKPEPDH